MAVATSGAVAADTHGLHATAGAALYPALASAARTGDATEGSHYIGRAIRGGGTTTQVVGDDSSRVQQQVRAARIDPGLEVSGQVQAPIAPAIVGEMQHAGQMSAIIDTPEVDRARVAAVASEDVAPASDERKLYILGFAEAPVASYRGGIDGIPAAPRGNDGRLQVHSGAAISYAEYLEARQLEREAAMSRLVGRQIQATHRMQHAFNGVIVELSQREAMKLASMRDISLMEPYREDPLATDTGPLHINADSVWMNGSGLPGATPANGEGVVLGIIDTGVNAGSPSFAAVDMDGYQHVNPLGEGNYLGTCQEGGIDEGRCNSKLIGGYDFICTLTTVCSDPSAYEVPGFRDDNGHGSHVGSTAGGNRRMATFQGNDVEISGVAPRANLVFFDACYTTATGQGSCPNVSTLASINQAVADGVVHGLGYSISGGTSPWTDANSAAFLAATDAGIYVSASAGNSGPGPGTLGHRQPWVHSIAAAQHGRGAFVYQLQVDGAPASVSPVFLTPGGSGVAQTGDIPAGTPLVVSPTIDAADDGCAAFPAGTFQDAIAVIRRGTCPFSDKVNNAEAAGAQVVVIANNQAGAVSPSVPGTSIPAYAATQAQSDALRDWAAGASNPTAGIPFAAEPQVNTPDQLAAFSSRGPVQFDLVKPDVTAPGVAILAAYAGPAADGFDDIVNAISGTSMSQPHNLGAAALLRQMNPDWTVHEIKSALMMTAVDTVLLEDGVTPANAFAGGSGSIRVDRAARAGLVLDESTQNFLDANPAAGGDPSSLNLASMANANCQGTCSFSRTFRATGTPQSRGRMRGGISGTYSVFLEGLEGSVSHSRFTLQPDATITLDIEIDASNLPVGEYSFGQLVLNSSDPTRPQLRLPIVVMAQEPVEPPPGGALVDRYTDAFITHPTGGAGGAPASRLQNTSLGMTTFGANSNNASGFAMADSFTVPEGGWSIESFRAYAYQTGSGTTSTLTGLVVWILDGPPDDPASNVVFGNDTTNVMTSTGFSGVYRDLETGIGDPNRPVFEAVAEFSTPIELDAGDYWIAYSFTGSLVSGPWAPPRTILGETVTGAAMQRTNLGVWQAFVDGEDPAKPQGMPFIIEGTAN